MPDLSMLGKALAIWIAMSIGAVLNGTIRETLLISTLGEGVARPLSAALLLVVIYILTYVFWRWAGRPRRLASLWTIGVLWLALTVVFEAGLGFSRGMSTREVLALYNPVSPTLWAFVLVGILVAPAIVGGHRKGAGFD